MHDLDGEVSDSYSPPVNFGFLLFLPPPGNMALRKAEKRVPGDAGVPRLRRSRIRLRIDPGLFLSGGGTERIRSDRVITGRGRGIESASEEKPPKLELSDELEVEKRHRWLRSSAELRRRQ